MTDPILLWNEVALEANRMSHTNGQGEQAGPPLSARALAIIHLAMYDAFAGVAKDPKELPSYLSGLPDPGAGSTAEAAIAAAAHGTLSALFPSQRPVFDFVLSVAGAPGSAGHEFGAAVAKALLADRATDPGVGSSTYVIKQTRGKHRPDPDNPAQGVQAPDYGRLSKGFAIAHRIELAAPPFDDADYRAALRQVRAKGIRPDLMGTLPAGSSPRTPGETLLGVYWAYDGASQLGTPPRLYNQIIRLVACKQKNSVADNARLFAFVNAAMADAGILAWDQKYIHELWRPVVGVREHDSSIGPGTTRAGNQIDPDCDPFWLPLGAPNSNKIGKNATPNFPAYPSGHATFGAAAFHVTRLFYGQGGTIEKGDLGPDKLFDGLSFMSEELNGTTTDNTGAARARHSRDFPNGLWQMIEENGFSRVALGVHWIFDAFAMKGDKHDIPRKDKDGKHTGGVPLGLLIAEDIFRFGGGRAPKRSTVGPRPQPPAPTAGRTATFQSNYLH